MSSQIIPLKAQRYVFDLQEDCNARKRYKPEEIVAKLRQVDVLVSQGQNLVDAIRQIGRASCRERV